MFFNLIINSLIIFFTSFAVASICIPLVIKLAIKKRLLGEYGEGRHVHKGYVPRLGGVAVFGGFFFGQLYFMVAHAITNTSHNRIFSWCFPPYYFFY